MKHQTELQRRLQEFYSNSLTPPTIIIMNPLMYEAMWDEIKQSVRGYENIDPKTLTHPQFEGYKVIRSEDVQSTEFIIK